MFYTQTLSFEPTKYMITKELYMTFLLLVSYNVTAEVATNKKKSTLNYISLNIPRHMVNKFFHSLL